QNSEASKKRILYIGLNDEKVKLYLHHIGFVITFGDTSPLEIIARELFGNKIKSSFHWKDLNKKENDQLLDTLQSQAKWINDITTFYVRSTECSTYVNEINKVFLYKNSLFYQYCKNANIMELLGYFNDPEDCIPKFWNQLARIGRVGAFKDKQIFSELCEIFVEMTNRINEGKGLQNIRYPEQFSNFLTILVSSSLQTYAIFQKNLTGRTIQNI
ncbi:6683_t:CDS:2, partial [Funneliformis mosseae]